MAGPEASSCLKICLYSVSITMAVTLLLSLILSTLPIEANFEGGGAPYKRYSILRLKPLLNMDQVDIVLGIRERLEDERHRKVVILDDVIVSKRRPIAMIVSPEERAAIEKELTESSIEYTVIADSNLDEIFLDLSDLNERQRVRYDTHIARGHPIAPNHFMTLDKIKSLFDNWQNDFSDLVRIVSVGLTAEKRETWAITINGHLEDLPGVWIDAGIDSRYWLSTAAAIHIAYELLHSSDSDILRLRSKYRWFIVPTVNPDGYYYSFTQDRLWRKTRTPYDNGCFGADINRNFDVHFITSDIKPNPCLNAHRGPDPFSEVETRNLRDTLLQYNATSGGLLAYFSLQGHGQFIMPPWAGRDMFKTEDYEYLMVVANDAIAGVGNSTALSDTDRTYKFGTAPDLFYPIRGSVLDWVRQYLNVRWLYAVNLYPPTTTDDNDRYPVGGIGVAATAVYVGGNQALTIVNVTLRAIEAGPVVDMLEIYAGDELRLLRERQEKEVLSEGEVGNEGEEVVEEETDGDDDVIDDAIDEEGQEVQSVEVDENDGRDEL